jgi:hypothetical protein
VTDAFAASRLILDRIITRLGEQEMMDCTEQVLEEYVTTAGRDLQRQLIQDQLDARAAAEPRRPPVTGADQIVRRRIESGHTRLVATTVGRVQATRIAYRAPAVSNLYPADMVLALPDRLYSFPLQKAIVHEAATGSLREAADTLHRMTGQRISTGQLMDTVTAAAADIRVFYQHQPIPAGSPADLLVLSIDATGVAMIPTGLRTPAPQTPGPHPPHAQLSSRDRTGRSRMATVTACYDAVAVPRSPADVLPATAAERATRRPGPQATGRHLDASVEHGIATMTTCLFDHAQHRDPQHRRRWIVLVDGDNHQLDRIRSEADNRGIRLTIIVDFIHVLQYLWDAAADLHPTQPGRAGFVEHTARDLLESHTPQVINRLTAVRHTLGDDTPAPGLDRAIAYLTAKQPYLGYRLALTMGWPIATGVIEGACRHLVKDRLAITGARWSLPGAEAVLLLRAVITNGDLDAYWKFHLQQEHERTHTSRYQQQYDLAA